MMKYEVKMSRKGGGSGVFTIPVNAASPDEARRIAENMNQGYIAQAVKQMPR